MNHMELYEKAEIAFLEDIERFHKMGLNYWLLLKILLEMASILQMKADAEYYLKGGR